MDTEKKAKLNTNSYINILAIKKNICIWKGTLQIKQFSHCVNRSPYQACPPQALYTRLYVEIREMDRPTP